MAKAARKPHLLDNNLEEWQAWSLSKGGTRFRGEQIFRFFHQQLKTDPAEINIPAEMRKLLTDEFEAIVTTPLNHTVSRADETSKDLWEFHGKTVESVWLPYENRQSLCVSVQFGCSLDCSFCATGKLAFQGNLSTGEILNQIYSSQRIYGKKITNIVFMGMGEPFYNYDNVLKACEILNHDKGVNISQRRITVSTSGVLPGIKRFVEEKRPYCLALSVHSAIPEKRDQIMDIEKKFSITEIEDYLKIHRREMQKGQVMIEYIMIKNRNMGKDDVKALARLAHNINAKVNLIPLNTAYNGMERPDEKQMEEFKEALMAKKILVFNRNSPGRDIQGACGMLAGTLTT